MEIINFPKPKIHLFVCTNNRNGESASCAPRIDDTIVTSVKKWVISQGLAKEVYCTKTRCLGFCNSNGGVACVYPNGNFYTNIQSEEHLKQIIMEKL